MDQLVNFIIRPPRMDYNPDTDLLDKEFTLRGRLYQRKDLQVNNSRGNVLQCSHYMPVLVPEEKTLPCVIYCHGNSGSRMDASEAAIILLPSYITVFALDFSGSGLSEGEHVTLGWNEKDDLKAVVDYLRNEGNVSFIGLWGRSMGAVTSLFYGAEDPSIAGIVLDSPFSNLNDLMMELVENHKVRLPKFTVKVAIQYMRKVIQRKANFDIMSLNSLEVAKQSYVPALFGHATGDDFIQPHHSDRIYDSYAGDKNIIKFEGDHNSPRPQFYFDSITIFFHNVLHPPSGVDSISFPVVDTYHSEQNGWDPISEFGLMSHHSFNPSFSTGDAIDWVRYRRPMSRMEVPSGILNENIAPEAERIGIEVPSGSALQFDPSCMSQVPNGPDNSSTEHAYDSSVFLPYSIEDEDRMLSEAIMLSLKENIPDVTEDVSTSSQGNILVQDDLPRTSFHSNNTVAPANSVVTDTLSTQSCSGTPFDTDVPSSDVGIEKSTLDTCSSSLCTEIAAVDPNTPKNRTTQSAHIMESLAHSLSFNLFRNNGRK